MKFCGEVGLGPRSNPLDFGGDPDPGDDPDPDLDPDLISFL